jgi:glycosyltransferase involved in cell wall biosynthesis
MNIAFVSYWGIDDGLTQATVLPHVQVLTEFSTVDKVYLFTIERGKFCVSKLHDKAEHIPLISRNYKNVLLNKIHDFIFFTSQVCDVVKNNRIDLIICRSSLAGGIGHRVSKKCNTPYIVESFEPHANYMEESGVWKKYDPRYWLEVYFQVIQRKHAKYILPVARNYAQYLVRSGVPEGRIITVPCTIDCNKFHRDLLSNKRSEIGINEHATVGIYVGKFGGMYYDEEAFDIFLKAKDTFENFFLLILTPHIYQTVERKIVKRGFSNREFRIINVSHDKVSSYLSIANFAFATYKPSYSKRFLSPIKVGEYWACGLPVLLTKGVGDDSSIIEESNCGATFELENVLEAMQRIKKQIADKDIWRKNRALAVEHRNPSKLSAAYATIIQEINSSRV